MSILTPHPVTPSSVSPPIPPLENGDHLTREEFERRYEAMPNLKKAELIEGVVYMSPPVRTEQHGTPYSKLIWWMVSYQMATPGTEAAGNSTVRLDLDNEPQPDGLLYIHPSRGGQAKLSADGYLEGAPELVAEVAAATVSIDLHTKLSVYRRNRVQEYLVWRVLDRAVDWFVLHHGKYEQLALSASGFYQSEVLPGLWLDAPALIAGDMVRVSQALQTGLASPEHSAFVARLAQAQPPNV